MDEQATRGDGQSNQPADLESKLIALEARVIEQEHRPTHVIYSWLTRTQWPEGDPRRNATLKAVIWRLLFSPMAVAAGGGLIAILSLIVLIRQTGLLQTETGLLQTQNKLLQDQNESFRESIRPVIDPRTTFHTSLLDGSCDDPGFSDTGGAIVYAADAGACSASN